MRQIWELSDTQKQHYLYLKAKCFEEAQDFDNAYNCFAQSNLLAKKSREYLRLNPEGYFKSFTDELGDLVTRFSGITMACIATGVIWILNPASLWDVIYKDYLHVSLYVGGLYFALRGNVR